MINFNFTIDTDLEIRTCDSSSSFVGRTAELIKWSKCNGKRYCFVLAYFTVDDEGADLRFVGDRFWENIPQDKWEETMTMLNYARQIIDRAVDRQIREEYDD